MSIGEAPKLDKGFLFIELIDGVEGQCLSIGDGKTGTRVAGSKPWGGGEIINRWRVNGKSLIKEIEEELKRQDNDL